MPTGRHRPAPPVRKGAGRRRAGSSLRDPLSAAPSPAARRAVRCRRGPRDRCRGSSRGGAEGTVGAVDDLAEAACGAARSGTGVQQGVEHAQRAPERLHQPAGQGRPEGSHRAGAADHRAVAVHQHLIAGGRIGDARHIRYATARRAPVVRHPGGGLPGRQTERLADPATGRAAGGAAAPHPLVAHMAGGRVGVQAGATAGQRVRTGGREVGVRQPVADAVPAAVVTGRGAHRHPERRGVGERLVDDRPGLVGPERLGRAPADAQRGRRRGVVDGHGERVREPLVGVVREVHLLLRAGRQRARDLDVQQYLAVGTVGGPARHIAGRPDVHRGHPGAVGRPSEAK